MTRPDPESSLPEPPSGGRLRPARGECLRALAVALAAAAILYVSHLPLLLDGRLVPDGDEAVLGLMAMRLLRGDGWAFYFWGQNYGMAAIETGSAALFFSLFGISAASLKAAMLLLWSAGGAFLALAARRAAGTTAAVIAALVLAASPAWGEWAMKARGGYLTAFLFASAACWLLAGGSSDRSRGAGGGPLGGDSPDGPRGLAAWGAIGACAAIAFLAQPLWLLLLAPLLALRAWEARGLRTACGFAAGALPVALAGWLAQGDRPYWRPGLFDGADPIHALRLLPSRLLVHLGGAYLYERSYVADAPRSAAAAAIWLVLLASVFALALALRGGAARFAVALAAGMVLVAAFSLWIGDAAFGFRYYLPLSGALPLPLALALPPHLGKGRGLRWTGWLALALLLGSGALALAEVPARAARTLPDDPYALVSGEVEALAAELRQGGVAHVYCLDPLLQWNLMFATREALVARWLDPADRRPEYPAAVDAALASGAPVAVVGRRAQAPYLAQRLGSPGAAALASALTTRHLVAVGGLDRRDLETLGFTLTAAGSGTGAPR